MHIVGDIKERGSFQKWCCRQGLHFCSIKRPEDPDKGGPWTVIEQYKNPFL